MFYDRFIELCKEVGKKPTIVAEEIGFHRSTPSKWKTNGFKPKQEIVTKISEYFDVSTDYLLGKTDIKKTPSEALKITDDDIKFALFGGAEADITDEMYEEVKQFAEFVKNKYKKD